MRGLLLVALALQCALALLCSGAHAEDAPTASFWDFVVKDGAGTSVSLHDFKRSKVVLVVNVASACGYTDQNYKELQALYEKYHASGFEILGFPCNQFGGQEPNDDKRVLQFVQEQYQVTFPIFAKIDVNGENAHPLFKYLTTTLTGFVTNDIKWNFSKFLVVDGVPNKRYGTSTSPFQIESDIRAALGLANHDEKDL